MILAPPQSRRPTRTGTGARAAAGAWCPAVLLVLCTATVGPAPAAERPTDPPVAPSPEAVIPATAVAPASLAGERPASVPLGSVPLAAAGAPRAAAGRSSPRPLPDWGVLAAVGAAFAALAAFRFRAGRSRAALPPDVFELLGDASLGGQHAVRIVRFGPRTLLLGLSAAGVQTLAEVSDPQATECIVAACRGSRSRAAEAPRGGTARPRHAGTAAAAHIAARAAGGTA